MLKLYGGLRTRAAIVQWYLEELGIPYETVPVDLQAGEQHKPDYLAVNPVGKVPAIADGDFTLWESGAILLYLVEKYGNVSDLEQRALLNQWINFGNATLGPSIVNEASREKALPRFLAVLEKHLGGRPYLLGEEFSVADVLIGAMLNYIPMFVKMELTDYPALVAYVARLSERPGFQKTLGNHA